MQQVDGRTRVCGLIGNPIEHTLSPLIHNTLAKEFGHNLIYVPFLVQEGFLEQAVKGAQALHILGMNVTVPYKSEVISSLEEVDSLAKKIGAVNTLVRTEKGFKGYNTDMAGLLRAMESDGILIKGEKVIILGAGGAARAVAYLCAENGAEEIYILNRTLEKAELIAAEIRACYVSVQIAAYDFSEMEYIEGNNYIAIQATSVGLYPNSEKTVTEDAALYEKVKVGYDLIYKPFETKFMKLLREMGKESYNGLKMLLYQGIIAYELWNEVEISEEAAQKIYVQMRKELGIYE